jgi:hypothetical protein
MAKKKYTDEFPALAEMYAREGMIEVDIAKKLGVSETTFESYKNKYPEFLAALKRGKEPVDFQVECALLKRALGYTYTETKREMVKLDDGADVVRSMTETIKEVVPDVTAQIFWLKNRNPQRWRDVKGVEMTGKDGKDLYAGVIVLPAKDPKP